MGIVAHGWWGLALLCCFEALSPRESSGKSLFSLDVAACRGSPMGARGDLEEADFSVPLHKGANHLLNSPHKLSKLLWISLLIHLDTLS